MKVTILEVLQYAFFTMNSTIDMMYRCLVDLFRNPNKFSRVEFMVASLFCVVPDKSLWMIG